MPPRAACAGGSAATGAGRARGYAAPGRSARGCATHARARARTGES